LTVTPHLRTAAQLTVLAVLVAGCLVDDLGTAAPNAPTPSVPTTSGEPGETAGLATPAPTPGPTAVTLPRSGTWTQLTVAGDAPEAREDHTWTVAEDGRTAYLFGGRDGATIFDDLWSFDLETERWQRQRIDGATPAARFGHDAAWLPGHGLVVWAGQAGAEFFEDVWLLDPAQGNWEMLNVDGEIPVARYGSCSGVGPDGRFWISHGFTANGVRFDDTRSLSLESRRWTDRTPPGAGPIKRCLHACWWTTDGRLGLYGGQTNGIVALGDLWFLTPGLDGEPSRWAEAPGQRAPARQLPAVARRGALTLIVGGRDLDGEVIADIWVLADDATELVQVQAPGGPPARAGAALVYDDTSDRLVMFGGRADDAFGDVWELTLR
jgi:galactose oxidase-like protein/Kelch motif protein